MKLPPHNRVWLAPAGGNHFENLGRVVALRRKPLSVMADSETFVKMLIAASRLQYLCFFVDEDGEDVGYFVFGYLSRQSELLLVRDASSSIDSFQLNEGTSLWMIDFSIEPHRLKFALGELAAMLATQAEQRLRFRRVKNGRLIYRNYDATKLKKLSSKFLAHTWRCHCGGICKPERGA